MKEGIAMKFRTFLLASVAVIPCTQAATAQSSSEAEALILPPLMVTATPLDRAVNEVATPVTVVTGDKFVRHRQSTLGETLASEPGINFDNFGAGASRPVIRGQTLPRVKILSAGSELFDASAISPDHAIVTEPLLLNGIEVLRGPTALFYGGGAIGGVVNLLDSKVPTSVPKNYIEGVGELRAGSADKERTAVGGVTVGAGNFAMRLEGVHRRSDDYRVPNFVTDRVHDSDNDTSTVSVGASWIGEKGYLGAAFTRQKSEYGIAGHSHEFESCHPHGSSLHCGGHGHGHGHGGHDDDDDDHHGAGGGVRGPYVDLRSSRYDIRGEYRNPIDAIERLRLRASLTDYEHQELESNLVSTTFKNKGYDIRLEAEHAPIGNLHGAIGIHNSRSDFSAIGEEDFVPPSKTYNTGVFLFESLNVEPFRFEMAVRQDWQKIETTLGRSVQHKPFSISGAAIWNIQDKYSVALSLARSQRAPNVQELYARGIHLATNTYELGTATLPKETAKSIDLTFRKTTGDTTFTLGLYHISYDNYIYADTLDQHEEFRLIRYVASDAKFQGVDGEIRHQITPEIGAAVFGDYVRAKLTNNRGNLPRIPAGRLGLKTDGTWGNFSADLEFYHVFRQTDIAAYESNTSSYNMLNATIAYKLPFTPLESEIFLRGNNLTNELAFNHASFIKNAAPLRGRNIVLGVRTSF